LAAMAIALVDVSILHVGAAGAPSIHEELTREAKEGRTAQGGAAMAQISGS
jgi:hypothetical protein